MISHSANDAINVWLLVNRIRSRSEAIRRLIELGLQASNERTPPIEQ